MMEPPTNIPVCVKSCPHEGQLLVGAHFCIRSMKPQESLLPQLGHLCMMAPNAKLSGGVAVRLSAGLERGSAVKDEHEKNSTLGTPTVFQLLEKTTVLEPFTVEQRP